jgi:trimeric autotransporter adhesin
MPLNRADNVPNNSLVTPYMTIDGYTTQLGGSVNTLLSGPVSTRPTTGAIGLLFYNTTINELQTFTIDGWVSVATAPYAPTSVVASNISVPYAGTPAASIRFTPSTVGSPGATYTVVSTPGSLTTSGSASPLTISGLTSGTSYTFTVTASNSYGSAISAASSSITAGTVPPTPTTVVATQSSLTAASVSFVSPTNTGGATITSYTVTASPGGVTATGSSSPITVNGLTTNNSYTFNVVANSAAGPSASSADSNLLAIGNGYGTVTLSNTSGSALTNVVVPVTVTYNSNYLNDFSALQFNLGGSVLQHWVGNYTSGVNAQVYIKVPTLPTGNSTIIVAKSLAPTSNVSGMFSTFTNFPAANTVPSGWQLFTSGASFTAVPGTTGTSGAFTLNTAGGGAISWLTTTANQGISIAVDTLCTPNVNTGSVGSNSILEIGLHGNATQTAATLHNGFKYRWDARHNFGFRGLLISRARTSNVATIIVDQTAFQLNTYYPAGARNIVVGDLIQVGADDTTFNATSAAVTSVVYNGTQVTLTYANTGTTVSTTAVTNAWPNYYTVGVDRLMDQGWLNNPFGGTYGTSPVNDAGWSNFDETYSAYAQNNTNADGAAAAAAVFRAKYVGTAGSGTFSSYVNNVATGRNFVETGTRTSSVASKALTSNVATLTTVPPHGLAAGDTVTISGVGAPFDGTKTVTQIVGSYSFTYAATGSNVTATALNPYNNSTTVTASSTRFSQDGIAGVSSHVGSATFNWIAIYPTFSGVSDAVYAALL